MRELGTYCAAKTKFPFMKMFKSWGHLKWKKSRGAPHGQAGGVLCKVIKFACHKSAEPATVQLKVEDSNANLAPTWRDRGSSDE